MQSQDPKSKFKPYVPRHERARQQQLDSDLGSGIRSVTSKQTYHSRAATIMANQLQNLSINNGDASSVKSSGGGARPIKGFRSGGEPKHLSSLFPAQRPAKLETTVEASLRSETDGDNSSDDDNSDSGSAGEGDEDVIRGPKPAKPPVEGKRCREETAEEKRLRKQAVKEDRRERRAAKKDTRSAYREEALRLNKSGGDRHLSVFKYSS